MTAERTLTTVCCNGLHKRNEVLFTLTTETDPEGVLLSCALAESISVGPQFASLLKTVTSPSLSTMREQLPTLLDVRGESGEALMRSFTFPSCPLRMWKPDDGDDVSSDMPPKRMQDAAETN